MKNETITTLSVDCSLSAELINSFHLNLVLSCTLILRLNEFSGWYQTTDGFTQRVELPSISLLYTLNAKLTNMFVKNFLILHRPFFVSEKHTQNVGHIFPSQQIPCICVDQIHFDYQFNSSISTRYFFGDNFCKSHILIIFHTFQSNFKHRAPFFWYELCCFFVFWNAIIIQWIVHIFFLCIA